jgi:hypothetical protein
MKDGLDNFNQLEPNSLLTDLLAYVESQLPEFTTSKEFKEILVLKKNENQHSSALCVFMTHRSSSRYYFERETSQKGSSAIDIGVYFGSSLIYTIEAKVLPTPKGTKSKPRNDYEYVYGAGGGIQRFKDENHGVDHKNNLFPEGGLIGFVKEADYYYWLKKINQWIVDASWDSSEQLEIIYIKGIAKLKSKHSRKSKSKIILHHFWVAV